MQTPSFFKRLIYALAILVRFVFDGKFAAPVFALWEGKAIEPAREPAPAPLPPPVQAQPVPVKASTDSALQLLSILQRDGRLIDFLQEDISSYEDVDVGGAARVLHEGCRKALGEYFVVEPVRSEGEGAMLVVEKGFDPVEIRLTGNVSGEPPFRGALRHHGWRVTSVKLPAIVEGQDQRVLAPAEVEL